MNRAIRRTAVATFLCGLLPAFAVAQVPPPPPPPPAPPPGWSPPQTSEPRDGTGVILGRVVEAASGRPVGGATVSVGGSGRVLTDGEGQFVFFRVPRGIFSITATKPGYVDGAHGRLRPLGSSTPVEMAEGERLGDIVIPIWKVAVITGAVVDEAGEPIVGIEVRAYRRTLTGGRRRLTSQTGATTDDRGVYRLPNLVPGEYIVGVESTTVAVPTDVADLYRSGITTGDPGRQAIVRELSAIRGFPNGVRVGNLITSGGFNRTLSLPPVGPDGRVFAYPTTFYPAAGAALQATVITLASGDERSGVDIQMKPVPTIRVSGVVSGPEGPTPHAALRLIPAASEPMMTELEVANTMSDSSGAFTFIGVTPGQYTLKVMKQPPLPPSANTPSTIIQTGSGTVSMSFGAEANAPPALPVGNTLWTSIPVSVGASDIQDLAVPIRTGVRVTGRVEFEGTSAPPKPDAVQRIQVSVEPLSPGELRSVFSLMRGRVEADGRFATASLPGGQYFIRAGGAPQGWSFKSATHEGRDLADVPLDATADLSGVVITFTDRPSELTGTVLGAGGANDPGAIVLLFPADAAAWTELRVNSRRLRAARPQQNGTYRITSLPSGDYHAIAVPDEISSDWQDQKVLESLSRGATLVRIEDGQKKTLSLRVSDIARLP